MLLIRFDLISQPWTFVWMQLKCLRWQVSKQQTASFTVQTAQLAHLAERTKERKKEKEIKKERTAETKKPTNRLLYIYVRQAHSRWTGSRTSRRYALRNSSAVALPQSCIVAQLCTAQLCAACTVQSKFGTSDSKLIIVSPCKIIKKSSNLCTKRMACPNQALNQMHK